jgi:hypothetical protein
VYLKGLWHELDQQLQQFLQRRQLELIPQKTKNNKRRKYDKKRTQRRILT